MNSQRNDIIHYFNQLDRSYFLKENKAGASLDCPVPIGFGQTVSQPTLVLSMTLALDPQPDSRVLEIGTGSGYQTALLASFCQELYTVERIKSLQKDAKARLDAMGFSNIHYKLDDGSFGWPEHKPYDRIMVTASVSRIPDELLSQMKPGAIMLIPVGDIRMQELLIVEKDAQGNITQSILEYVAFVRLKGDYE